MTLAAISDDGLLAPLAATHDPVLVAASYAIAVFAALGGLLIGERIAEAPTLARRHLWLVIGATILGFGVWTMHFVGMIALTLPVTVTYDTTMTLASLLPAVLASACALHVVGIGQRDHRRVTIAGALIGTGIVAMHYTGMAAMRLDAAVRYDPLLFATSIVIAMALGIAAMHVWTTRPVILAAKPAWARHAAAAGLIGLAITGMHYTAMAATDFVPAGTAEAGERASGANWLAGSVAIMAVLLTAAAIVAAVIDAKLRAASNRARLSLRQLGLMVDRISDGVVLFDNDGRLIMCNKVFLSLFPGLESLAVPGTEYARLMQAWADLDPSPGGRLARRAYAEACQQRLRDGADGTEGPEQEQLADGRWMYVRHELIRTVGIIGVWTDVTSIKNLQSVYETQARRDSLTGIANRRLFEERLAHAASRAGRLRASAAVLYIDLDHFKDVNDRFGHHVGDMVLKEAAGRLATVGRDIDTVARLGGDEFGMILDPPIDRHGAETVARRLLAAVSTPIRYGEVEHRVRLSIGIAISPPFTFDTEEAVRIADDAMYEAKRAGRNTFRHRIMDATPQMER